MLALIEPELRAARAAETMRRSAQAESSLARSASALQPPATVRWARRHDRRAADGKRRRAGRSVRPPLKYGGSEEKGAPRLHQHPRLRLLSVHPHGQRRHHTRVQRLRRR